MLKYKIIDVIENIFSQDERINVKIDHNANKTDPHYAQEQIQDLLRDLMLIAFANPSHHIH